MAESAPPDAPGPDFGLDAVGVDIGGTKVLAVRLGRDGSVIAEVKLPTPRDGLDVIDQVVAAVGAVCDAPGVVGVGAPGMIDAEGLLCFSPHIPGLVGLPIGRAVGDRLGGIPVRVANDATCAGWAEHVLGAARGIDDLLMVTLGTGIGGGIIAGGQLAEGAHGFAGEFGHMVIDPHGPPCPCGKQGCWERFASGSGLGWLGREAATAGQAPRLVELAGGDREGVRGEHVTAAAAEGDPAARQIMDRLAWWIALGLANLTNIIDPAAIVLGGGLIEAGPILMDPVRRAFSDLVEAPGERRGLVILSAALGERAGAIGAGILASESVVAGAENARGSSRPVQ